MNKDLMVVDYDKDQINLIKNTIAKGASDNELQLFIEICKRSKLDPFTRQIYSVQRWDSSVNGYVRAAQTSVDGLRLVAERSGKYEGQTAPMWCGRDGVWKDLWIPSEKEKYPYAAKIGVYKSGVKEPFIGIARWDAYVQTKKDGGVTAMWHKMSDTMLAKCAECLALRKGFPNDTFGLYAEEEMDQITNPDGSPVMSERAADINERVAKVVPEPPFEEAKARVQPVPTAPQKSAEEVEEQRTKASRKPRATSAPTPTAQQANRESNAERKPEPPKTAQEPPKVVAVPTPVPTPQKPMAAPIDANKPLPEGWVDNEWGDYVVEAGPHTGKTLRELGYWPVVFMCEKFLRIIDEKHIKDPQPTTINFLQAGENWTSVT